MRPSVLIRYPWWPPIHAKRGDVLEGRPTIALCRNARGELLHGNTTPHQYIKQFAIIHDFVWSLDFVQQIKSTKVTFHIENIEVLNSKHIAINMFDTPWLWKPKVGTCSEIVLSLRIGGFLVDAWYMQQGKLMFGELPGAYELINHDPSTKLLPQVKVQSISFGPPIYMVKQRERSSQMESYYAQDINFVLETPNIITSHWMRCPIEFTKERYQDNHRTLLLDWLRAKKVFGCPENRFGLPENPVTTLKLNFP